MMVEYLHQDKKSGIFKYRRRVPDELRDVLGKREWVISLRTRDPERARQERDKVHRQIKAELATLSSMEPEQREYEEALRVLKDKEIIRRGAEGFPVKSLQTGTATLDQSSL